MLPPSSGSVHRVDECICMYVGVGPTHLWGNDGGGGWCMAPTNRDKGHQH
jgi:hypothetical protein